MAPQHLPVLELQIKAATCNVWYASFCWISFRTFRYVEISDFRCMVHIERVFPLHHLPVLLPPSQADAERMLGWTSIKYRDRIDYVIVVVLLFIGIVSKFIPMSISTTTRACKPEILREFSNRKSAPPDGKPSFFFLLVLTTLLEYLGGEKRRS